MTLSTRVIKIFLRDLDKPYVPLPGGLRLQVLPNLEYLPGCQKHQFAAFIEDRGILIVWADNPRHLLERAAHIEKQLMQVTWDKSFTQTEGKKEGVVKLDEVEADLEQSAGGANRPLMM
jgi:hypothetical protein